jgi:hypothetical protein
MSYLLTSITMTNRKKIQPWIDQAAAKAIRQKHSFFYSNQFSSGVADQNLIGRSRSKHLIEMDRSRIM